jgi:phage tail sheath protein FI
MPEYLSPGVYVEEIDAGPKPIEGVSTSTAGAVGVTVRGPTAGKPELVTSFNEFVRKFGSFLPDPAPSLQNAWINNATEGGRWWQFPLSVKGFFDNGGQRLYVKRVFAGGGLPASARTAANSAFAASSTFAQGLVSEIESDVTAGPNPPQFTVRHLLGLSAAGAGGAGTGPQVTLRNGETGQAIGGNFHVAAYDPASRRITLDAALPANTELRAARGDSVIIAPPVAGGTLAANARARGEWGNDLQVRARPMTGATVTLLEDPAIGGAVARAAVQSVAAPAAPGSPWVVTVQAAAGGQPASLTSFGNGDHVSIAGAEYPIANVTAGSNTFEIASLPAGTTWPAGTPVQRLRPSNDLATATNQLRMWGAAKLYTGAVVELDNGLSKEVLQVGSVSGDVVTLSGNLVNRYYEGHRARVVELELSVRYRPDGVIEAEEVFQNLRLVGRTSDPDYLVTRVNAASKLIELSDGGAAPAIGLGQFPAALNATGWLPLQNGNDNLASLSVDDFVGIDGGSGQRTGIQALEDIDEVSIATVPCVWSRSVHGALIQHCESLKDRFAIVDPRDGLDIEGVRSFREVLDTKYAALYYPWLVVRDPVAKQDVVVAPSAHMAGLYARVDVERGVHKAPANEVIRGITRLAADVTKREHDMLNPKNINVLRYFPGRGYRVWGARVVTSDAAWKYINVRRLFIYVEESIDEGTQWVVFEPNDEPLWARVRQTITNFLTSVWRSGALQGAKADEAFFVKCDHTTMTQDDIDNGRLICLIGIAPVKPAEFVIFRIQQKTIESQPA